LLKDWKTARKRALDNDHAEAIPYYESALNDDSESNHPVLRYDLALSFIALVGHLG
jgi:hypothetical protein